MLDLHLTDIILSVLLDLILRFEEVVLSGAFFRMNFDK